MLYHVCYLLIIYLLILGSLTWPNTQGKREWEKVCKQRTGRTSCTVECGVSMWRMCVGTYLDTLRWTEEGMVCDPHWLGSWVGLFPSSFLRPPPARQGHGHENGTDPDSVDRVRKESSGPLGRSFLYRNLYNVTISKINVETTLNEGFGESS